MNQQNLNFALEKVKSRLTPQSITRYEQFRNKLTQQPGNDLNSLTSAFGGLSMNQNGNKNNPFF